MSEPEIQGNLAAYLEANRTDYDYHVTCPVCNFEYMHPVQVEVNAGGKITTIDHQGTRTRKGEPFGRGVHIAVKLLCEDGHISELMLQFHKGQTGMAFTPTGDVGDFDSLKTIWRD